MRILQWLMYAGVLTALVGCGGGGGGSDSRTASVSGVVLDFNGNQVRDARVWINSRGETRSNAGGSFVIDGLPEGDFKVRAEIVQDGSTFQGENTVRVFEDLRSKSLQITVMRSNQRARVRGTVFDNSGYSLQGVRVYAIPTTDGGVYGSNMELTDADGNFHFDALRGGSEYKIIATGLGYNSDADLVQVSAGGEENLILTLKNPTDPLLPAPTQLEAVAWTTPSEITRSPQSRATFDYIKQLVRPGTPAGTITRNTVDGNWVEADLFWDAYPDNNAHIGFGIYRRLGTSGSFTAIDFLRDTEAEAFFDLDEDLQEFETWQYYITAINTSDFTANSESDPSNVAEIKTLGDLYALTPQQGPLRFRWESGSGATSYTVYVYESYPGIGVTPYWTSDPVSGTQVSAGFTPQSGRRYYYFIVGSANDGASHTVSQVQNFVAN